MPENCSGTKYFESRKKIYKGSGTISQSKNGYFSLKLFCEGKVTVDEVLFNSKQEPGEIIEDSSYYSLNAIDTEGNNWKTDSIKPKISACQGIDAFIVNGKFFEITCKKNISKSFSKNHLSLIFRGNIDIPCNKYSQTEIVIDGGKRKKSFKLTWIIHKLVRCYVSPGPGGRRAHEMRAVAQERNGLCDSSRTAAAPPRWLIKNSK